MIISNIRYELKEELPMWCMGEFLTLNNPQMQRIGLVPKCPEEGPGRSHGRGKQQMEGRVGTAGLLRASCGPPVVWRLQLSSKGSNGCSGPLSPCHVGIGLTVARSQKIVRETCSPNSCVKVLILKCAYKTFFDKQVGYQFASLRKAPNVEIF